MERSNQPSQVREKVSTPTVGVTKLKITKDRWAMDPLYIGRSLMTCQRADNTRAIAGKMSSHITPTPELDRRTTTDENRTYKLKFGFGLRFSSDSAADKRTLPHLSPELTEFRQVTRFSVAERAWARACLPVATPPDWQVWLNIYS